MDEPRLPSRLPILARALAVPITLTVFYGFAHPWLNRQILDEGGATEFVDVSGICGANAAELEDLRSALIESGICRDFWLIDTSYAASLALLAGTALFCAVVAGLAWRARGLGSTLVTAYRSAWAITPPAALAKAAVETALLTYASFEVTVLASHSYYPKLIAVVLIGGLIALYAAGRALLAPIPLETRESFVTPLTRAQAPSLWARLDAIARRVGTAPPDNVLLAENTSFYVTEFAVHHDGGTVTGKTLVLSRPLIGEMSADELSVVVGHELAHFAGGDTLLTQELYPRFVRASRMAQALAASIVGFSPRQLLDFLVRSFLPLLREQSRLRELAADATGASVASSGALADALVRIHVLSDAVGARWEAAQALHGPAPESKAAFSAALQRPLVEVATERLFVNPRFWPALFEKVSPHPLDTHPPLSVRLAALGRSSDGRSAAALVTTPVPEEARAAALLVEASEVLARTAAALEARVAEVAERDALVGRIKAADPTIAADRALLESHFPVVRWPVRDGRLGLAVGFLGLLAAGALGGAVSLADVPAAAGMLVVVAAGFGVWGVLLWVRHRGATLTLQCDRIECGTWDRPLLFVDIARFTWRVQNEQVTLTAHLRAPAPPFVRWPVQRSARSAVVVPLSFRGPSVPIANTILRYYQRGLESG